MSGSVSFMARYTAPAENADAVKELLGQMAAASRAEEGNLSYEVFQSLDAPGQFLILERYTSLGAFEAHRASAHFETLGRQRIIPLLDSREVSIVESRPF